MADVDYWWKNYQAELEELKRAVGQAETSQELIQCEGKVKHMGTTEKSFDLELRNIARRERGGWEEKMKEAKAEKQNVVQSLETKKNELNTQELEMGTTSRDNPPLPRGVLALIPHPFAWLT